MTPSDKQWLHSLPLDQAMQYWDKLHELAKKSDKGANSAPAYTAVVRDLALNDLFYLLVVVCKRVDLIHPWLYARTREVEDQPNGRLDLWSREHGKSSIITFGLTIQDILRNPEVTIGIFSHTRPIAKAFLRQIMREFEGNKVLHMAFPDILWGENTRDAQKWSEDEGLIVKRKSNPKESTVEAWGLVDGQPTSKHYQILLYDDIVVAGSVTTPEMISKTMSSLEQSYNLGVTPGGVRRFVGTRWHYGDCYATIKERGSAILREHPGREGGEPDGKPVFWSEEIHKEKLRDMKEYNYGCQILLNPKADSLRGFQRSWLKHYSNMPIEAKTNNYMLVDAASSKKKGSDYTAIWIVRLAGDGNYYCLPVVRDRLSLTERADKVFELHRVWKPIQVRYEKYGMMADIEHLEARMEIEQYRFKITEVGGQTSKIDRIGRLEPLFADGKIFLPKTLYTTDYQKVQHDLVRDFVEEEYMAHPSSVHDDMLDALARICEPDLKLAWPKEENMDTVVTQRLNFGSNTGWMAS